MQNYCFRNKSALKQFRAQEDERLEFQTEKSEIELKRFTQIFETHAEKLSHPILLSKYSYSLKAKMNTIRVSPEKFETNEECNITPKASFYERQTNNSTPISLEPNVFGPRLMFKVYKVDDFLTNNNYHTDFRKFVPELSTCTQEDTTANKISFPTSMCGPATKSPGMIFKTLRQSTSESKPQSPKVEKEAKTDRNRIRLQYAQLKSNIYCEEARIKAIDRKILKKKALIQSLNFKINHENSENSLLNDIIVRMAQRVLIYSSSLS